MRCQCCAISTKGAEVICTGGSVSIHTGMHDTGFVYGTMYSAEGFSPFLFIWIKWWKEPVTADVFSWGF